ncbi:glucan endo-1,6-beta-glucosidase, partial [Phenoliferia sp. Uapishka_3]
MLLSLVTALAGGLAVAASSNSASGIPVTTVRGVNLGGWMVSEPWMMAAEWSRMGCGDQQSEFDCMKNNETAQEGFTSHYDTWITQADIKKIASMKLNTIRIPLGYWLVESTVDRTSEYFATGGFYYLRRLCNWAAEAGLHVILDFHGAPGAQTADNPFTGQYNDSPGFYSSYNYERGYQWFRNITEEVHTDPSFRNVFALEVLNEPLQDSSAVGDLVSEFYAYGVPVSKTLVCFQRLGMSSRLSGFLVVLRAPEDTSEVGEMVFLPDVRREQLAAALLFSDWGSGDANYALDAMTQVPTDVIYDGHDCACFPDSSISSLGLLAPPLHPDVKWSSAEVSRDGYMWYTCTQDLTAQASAPVIVGEWSLSVSDDYYVHELSNDADDAATWFNKWSSAQRIMFEKAGGWIFWTCAFILIDLALLLFVGGVALTTMQFFPAPAGKTDSLDDPRWDYQLAVKSGYIGEIASNFSTWACDGYTS